MQSKVLTVALGHVGLHDIMPDHLEIGVANPMADGGFGASKEIIEDRDLVSEEHQTVDEVRPDESRSSGDENTLSLVGGEQLDGRETAESRVRDGVLAREVYRVGLEVGVTVGDGCGILAILRCLRDGAIARCRDHVVRAEVQGTDDVEQDLAVESKALEAHRRDFVAVLVECATLDAERGRKNRIQFATRKKKSPKVARRRSLPGSLLELLP